MKSSEILPCQLSAEAENRVRDYAKALMANAHKIGDHGLDKETFEQSGIFRSAIERIRGTISASMKEKRSFVAGILDFLTTKGYIKQWKSAESSDRHDYEVRCLDGRITAIETKGCLDGNNTNIFVRPPNADEFIVWSLCQNAAADPRHNAWSGIHTRLGAEMIASGQKIDALIIWDMLCGTIGRPCPKLMKDPQRSIKVGRYQVPPPCIFLFPKSIPDPRNNPSPKPLNLEEVSFAAVLSHAFGCFPKEIRSVRINARRDGADLTRQTLIEAEGEVLTESKWTKLRRSGA